MQILNTYTVQMYSPQNYGHLFGPCTMPVTPFQGWHENPTYTISSLHIGLLQNASALASRTPVPAGM